MPNSPLAARLAGRLVRLIPGLALLPALASGQSYAYDRFGTYSSAQAALPSEGPAAARINPASLADVNLASVSEGWFRSAGGKSSVGFSQLAVGTPWESLRWPVGLAAGFGYMSQGSVIDGSRAVFEEAEYDPGIAVSYPADPESEWRMAAGLAFAIREYNAFNAARSYGTGVGAGAAFTFRGGAGRFDLGLAYHDLLSPRVRLPDDYGDYKIPGWLEPSFAWATPARRLRTRVGFFLNEPQDRSEGPDREDRFGVSGWEFEVKAWDGLAVKGERTLLPGKSNLGLVLALPRAWVHCDLRLEINIGNDRFGRYLLPIPYLSPLLGGAGRDEGLGWLMGMAASVGI